VLLKRVSKEGERPLAMPLGFDIRQLCRLENIVDGSWGGRLRTIKKKGSKIVEGGGYWRQELNIFFDGY
jgi:hypothetical protein